MNLYFFCFCAIILSFFRKKGSFMKYEKVVNRYNDALKENILKCNTCEYSKTFEKKEQAYEQ